MRYKKYLLMGSLMIVLAVIILPYFIPTSWITSLMMKSINNEPVSLHSIIKVDSDNNDPNMIGKLVSNYNMEVDSYIDDQQQLGYFQLCFMNAYDHKTMFQIKGYLDKDTLYIKAKQSNKTYKISSGTYESTFKEVLSLFNNIKGIEEKSKFEEVEITRGHKTFKLWARVFSCNQQLGSFTNQMDIYYVPYRGIQKINNQILLNETTYLNVESTLTEIHYDLSDFDIENAVDLNSLDEIINSLAFSN